MKKLVRVLVLIAMLFPVAVSMAPTQAATGDPVINEFVFNHDGADTDAFIEVFGDPSTDYSLFTVLEIEGDSTGSGTVDAVLPVGTTDVGGFWTDDEDVENGTVTLLLVEGFSGSQGSDLDTDNDGTLDSTPWTRIVDDVGVTDGGSSDRNYTAVVLGPYFDGNPYGAGGASRIPNGSDTDSVSDWVRNDFDGAGLPSFPGVEAAPGEAINTPGAANEVAVAPPTVLTIMEIQGNEQYSDYQGEVVETSGVVTLFTANGAHCWLQDAEGDADAGTSDGIFVSGCAYPDEGPSPVVGDLIRIIASVEEQQFGNALPLTRLRSVALIEVQSSGNPLPAPIELSDLPDESIAAGIAFWEPLEGMLVSVRNAPVVAATSGYGEFAMLTKDDAKPGSGFYPETQQLFVRNLGGDVVDYNPERILVDDSSLDEAIYVMPGDRVRSLVGALDYTFGNYKIQPASFDIKTHDLPSLPASTRSGPNGDTVITTFNVENLFDLELNTPTVIDSIGQVGVQVEWGSGNTSTKDNTIRRQVSVCQGDSDETDPFDPSLEWDGFAKDTFDGLGAHAVSCAPVDELFLSEYVEGSSYNKAVEIYNGTGAAVNLGAGGYAIDIYFNGQTSPGTTIQLSGTLADGDVYVVADDGADAAILAVADQTSADYFFNGDDAVVLRKGGKDDASSTPTPEELDIQLTKLAMAIQVELELPEIIVVQETENTAILQVLGDRVNAAAGTNYMATSFETSDARGIEVGFLWDDERVDLLDAYQMSGSKVEGAFGPSSPSPGREPLVGVFESKGRQITIIGNHFKSKGGDDPLFGVNWPPIRITEVQRKAQAQAVREFVSTTLLADVNALVMVAGDLNDFPFGEPGEGPDHPVAILEGIGGAIPLTNLLNLEKDDERYTYVYDGNSQVLDHMLVSPALYDLLVAVDVLHFNAGFPVNLGGDASTPLRASDHDALEGRFRFK